MRVSNPIVFAGAVVLLLITPGPTNTLLGTSGATVGALRSLRLLPAELGGYLTSILVLTLAVGPQVTAHPALGCALRLVSALYLVFVASRLWRHSQSRASPTITARHVFITTLLNPKGVVFAFAIFPPLSTMPVSAASLWIAGFSVLVVLIALGWIFLGTVLGARAPRAVEAGTVRRIGAVILIVFALALTASAFR